MSFGSIRIYICVSLALRTCNVENNIVGLISKPRMDAFANFTGETFYCLNNSVFVKRLNNFYQTYIIISFNSSNVAFYIFLYI